MKRLTVFLTVLVMLLVFAAVRAEESAAPAAEESDVWDCPNCGAAGNTRKFCPECGAPRPDADHGGKVVQAGDIITFGTWEQDNDARNGAEPIDWIVLEISGGKALVVSRLGLVHASYAANSHEQTWANSTLRTVLNVDFYGPAFTDAEKAAILITDVDESAAQQDPERPSERVGDNTRDRIYVLSYAEIVKYFPTAEERKCYASEYIRHHSNRSDVLYTEGRTCWYWLRNPAYTNNASAVDWDGTIASGYIHHPYGVGRPCCRVNLAALGYAAAAEDGESVEALPAIPEGGLVTLGRFEQDNDPDNGPEPIEWYVLKVDEEAGKALLLSRFGLDSRFFHTSTARINWDGCALRDWLNGAFFDEAFTPEEQAGIQVTDVDNSSASTWPDRPLNSDATRDRVFIPSYREYMYYLGTQDIRRCAPTDYAIARGAFLSVEDDRADGRLAGQWWLRSHGDERLYVTMISPAGNLNRNTSLTMKGVIVRPMLWVDLNAGILKAE